MSINPKPVQKVQLAVQKVILAVKNVKLAVQNREIENDLHLRQLHAESIMITDRQNGGQK